MKSDKPKVLHDLAGKPMLAHVVATARRLEPDGIHIVYGFCADQVREAMPDDDLKWAIQEEQLGTAHAVKQALPEIPDDALILVLYGDVPLVRESTLRRLLTAAEGHTLGLLTTELDDPSGYGRIVRDDEGQVERIVEQKDASAEEREISEVNTGLLVVQARRLRDWLQRTSNDNAQGEYYLTDIIALAVHDDCSVPSVPADFEEVSGVNDRLQLAATEAVYRQRCARNLMREGVALRDPQRIDVRGDLVCGRDVSIDVNVVFEGKVTLDDSVSIGPNCVIRNAHIESGSKIAAFSHLDDVKVGRNCVIGPYARLRPDTILDEDVHVGNFVEIKKSHVSTGSKANHLSYIGDASIGKGVNIGAGTITCNYDGVNKHRTEIGDNAFIGSNSSLVAPVRVGAGATVGAGTTLNKDAPDDALTVARVKQQSYANWKRPEKKA